MFVKMADDSIVESDNIRKVDDTIMDQYYEVAQLIDDIVNNNQVLFFNTPYKIEDYFIDVDIPKAHKISENEYSITDYIGNEYTCILSLTDGREYDYSIFNNKYILLETGIGNIVNDFSFNYSFYSYHSVQDVEINMDDKKYLKFKLPTYSTYEDDLVINVIKNGQKISTRKITMNINVKFKEI